MTKSDRATVRQLSFMIGGLLVLTAVLIGVALTIYWHAPQETDPNQSAQVAERIAPAAGVYAGDTGRAAMQAAAEAAAKAAASQVAYGGTTDGKTIYGHLCTSCHTAGVAGAPKLGDKAMWAPRIAQGIDTLIKHATDGYHGPDGNFMPPKGGNPALTDAQIKAAVTWIVGQAK
ncbi:MAG: cytochrome c5 family protein [Xanthomonadaceae bacterium]|nr:cytochrome c5 family protein [Xanthomonadaceae bacterium]